LLGSSMMVSETRVEWTMALPDAYGKCAVLRASKRIHALDVEL